MAAHPTYMKSTFLPRVLPKAIFFDGAEMLGPFCQHCGWNLDYHEPKTQRCRAQCARYFVPNCGCHALPSSDPNYVINHNGLRPRNRQESNNT